LKDEVDHPSKPLLSGVYVRKSKKKTDIEEELKAVNKLRSEQSSMTGNQDDGVETIFSADY
jgi:hypothetical protein